MLQDMGHAGVIGRIGLETNGEDIVAVFSCDVEVVGASIIMLKSHCCQMQLGNVLGILNSKTV